MPRYRKLENVEVSSKQYEARDNCPPTFHCALKLSQLELKHFSLHYAVLINLHPLDWNELKIVFICLHFRSHPKLLPHITMQLST